MFCAFGGCTQECVEVRGTRQYHHPVDDVVWQPGYAGNRQLSRPSHRVSGSSGAEQWTVIDTTVPLQLRLTGLGEQRLVLPGITGEIRMWCERGLARCSSAKAARAVQLPDGAEQTVVVTLVALERGYGNT